jgi:hypothetical protein
MTWIDVVAEVTKLLGDRTDVESRVPNWVKWAQFRIGLKWYHPELETFQTGVYEVGSGTLSIPLDCMGIIALRDETKKVKLEVWNMQQIASCDLTQSGDPTAYCRYGQNFYFNKKVSAANAYTLWYYKRAVSEALSLNERWEEPICLLAASIANASLFDTDRATYFDALFKNVIMMIPEAKALDSRNWDFPIQVVL